MPRPLKATKAASKPGIPSSRELVSTGPKEVSSTKRHGKRDDQYEERPTTVRALVLRGKYEVSRSGEGFLMSRMTGREKLDLLAEDLMEKVSKSLMAPFRLEQCIRLAESQLSENLDDISTLKDPELFSSSIDEELKARTTEDNGKSAQDPSYIAQLVSNRIHNAYMLASAWKIVTDMLLELKAEGLRDDRVVQQLKSNEKLRTRYLVLNDIVNTLVDLHQRKFSVLATTTPHYKRYFKEVENEAGEKEVIFDWNQVRPACTSFLDSIIIELCFPRAPYPKAILYQILHDAVDEAPKEARRFPQALWDTVGDLSVAVQLQQILETPLLSTAAKTWKDESHTMPGTYDQWVEAQIWSETASEKYADFKDIIFPLSKTENREVLDDMWNTINLNYKLVSGKDIDALWQLTEILQFSPQWHYQEVAATDDAYSDDDSTGHLPSLAGGKKALAITDGADGSDSDDSMPALQDVSDSDESNQASDSDSDSYASDDDDEESEYNTDEEDEIRDLVKEAMYAVHEGDWANPVVEPTGPDPFSAEDRKGNPFLKLLGSLRGRMFTKSTKLKTTTGTNLPPQSVSATVPESKVPSTTINQADRSTSQKTTIEEVSDEDSVAPAVSKKKKPKKKKKKPTTSNEVLGSPSPPIEPMPSSAPGRPLPTATDNTPKPTSKATPPPAKPKVAAASQPAPSFSIPLDRVTTAQSARSYLKAEHLDAPKAKTKSRPDHASIFSFSFSPVLEKFGVGKEEKRPPQEEKEKRKKFANLSRKTKDCLHQILRTADTKKSTTGMKWDTFVKTLKDLGFKYDPSTAGSSVRFDPPDERDRAISFHKPHPDTTIDHIKLREWSKKLRKYYGWMPEDLLDTEES